MYNSKSYIKDKIKMLKEFGIKVDGSIENELKSMNSKSDIDRRCHTIIRDHLDKINDIESSLRRTGKKVP